MKYKLLLVIVSRSFQKLITIFQCLLVFFCLFPDASALSLSESIKQPDTGPVYSIAEIKTALEHLGKSVKEAIAEQKFTFKFQETVLEKSEEFINKIVELREQSAQDADVFKQDEKDIFMMNREILKQILNLNKKIISEIQEKKLDLMDDPSAFFKSSEWQEPQHLIALSSYWLGWNGYYGSLLFAENDVMRNVLLEEAIQGFSGSFLDSGKDAIIINSLFGRGLCYKQMKAYANALKDFKAVKEMVNKDDPLYLKCGYEETLIYILEHGGSIENRSYAELGPIGAMAVGDQLFEQKSYDKALSYYLALYNDSSSMLKDRMDSVWFRIAYIYCNKEAWNEAIPYLKKFYDRFPASALIDQAASLYYLAASNQYRKNAREEDYKTFIDSLRVYLTRCTACPGRSDAHFHLGEHYRKTDKMEPALKEYLQVQKDSTYYRLAKYYVLKSQVDQLTALKKKGQSRSKTATEIYLNGVRLVAEIQAAKLKQGEYDSLNNIEPYITILGARLFLFGPDDACKKNLIKLENFESDYPGEKSLFPEVSHLRLEYYLRLNMVKEAEREADKIPFNPQMRRQIQLKMAQIYINEDKLPNAIELYQDMLKKDPQSAEAMHDLGLLYEKTGQWPEALGIWNRLSKGTAAGSIDWLDSRYRMAYAFKKIGARDKACTILTMTMTLHPDMGNDQLKEKYLGLKSEMCSEGR